MDAQEIIPRLWVGSKPDPHDHYWQKFSLLVFGAVEYQPSPKEFPVRYVIRAPLYDRMDVKSPEMSFSIRKAFEAGSLIAESITKGHNVCVTCLDGTSRACAIAALGLHFLTNHPGWYCLAKVESRRKVETGRAIPNWTYREILRCTGPLKLTESGACNA